MFKAFPKDTLPLLGGEGVWQKLEFLSLWERCRYRGCEGPIAVRADIIRRHWI
jgi:hypothetical protein